MEGLSPRQQEVYDYIWQYNEQKGMCPSIQDVADGLGLASTTIATYVDTLKNKGYVISEYGTPRAIRAIAKKEIAWKK